MVAGTVLPSATVKGVVGNSGLRRRTYLTPVFAPESRRASSSAALGTETSRLREDLVVELFGGGDEVGACVEDVVGGVVEGG